MKKQVLLLIVSLLVGVGNLYGQCTSSISGGTTTICYNTSPGTFTATGGGGTSYAYLWYLNGSATATTTQTYNPGNLTSSSTVYCEITCDGSTTATSNTISITVDPASVGGSISGSATVCSGTNSTSLTLSGHTGTVEKWEYSTNGGSSYTEIANTTTSLTATNLTTTTIYRAVVKSGVCSSTNSGTATVTVNPVSVGGTLGGGTAVCTGTNSTLLTLTGYTGSIIKWQYSEDNWTTPVDIVNTSATYTATNLILPTKYRVVVTSGACSSDYSSVAEITVDALATGGTLSGDATVCSGTNSTLLSLAGESGTISKWQYSTDGGSVYNDITHTTSTYTATNLTTTTKYQVVVTNGACTSNSTIATVTVNPVSVGGALEGSTAVCIGTNSTLLTLSGNTGSITKWQYSTNGGSSYSDIANTTNTYTATNLTTTTIYRVVVTSGVCAPANSTVATITVQPDNATNVAFTGSLTVGGTLTVTYDFSSTACFPDDRPLTRYTWNKDNNSDHSSYTANIAQNIGVSTYVLPASAEDDYIMVKVEIWNGSSYQTVVESSWTSVKVAANSKPVASSIIIDGSRVVGQTLTGAYSYSDAENDPQATATYQWLRSSSSDGTSTTNIGTNSPTYVLVAADADKYIGLKVTPKASTGTLTGDPVTSSTPWEQVISNPPVVSNVQVIGDAKSGTTVYGYYLYSDVENDPESGSTYAWYYADNSLGTVNKNTVSGVTSVTYKIADTYIGKYIGFSVIPRASSGVTPGVMVTSPTFIGPVTNDVPVASNVTISGPSPLNVTDILTGNYIYSDPEGDLEGTSTFEWLRDVDNNISGAVSTGIFTSTYQVSLADTGKYLFFRVTPKAATGNLSGGTLQSSAASSRANTPPYAIKKPITYTTFIVGSVLTGDYEYRDHDLNPQGTSTFRWLRDGTTPIPGATALTYTVDLDDEGHTLVFEVTPVSSTGYPNIGTPVLSDPTISVPGNSKPTASEVCIDGKRAENEFITGKYHYDFPKAEGASTYQWYRDGAPIDFATGITYQLTLADLDKNITFAVTPKSVTPVKVGDTKESTRLARITISQVQYANNADTVALTAVPTTPGSGVFSGPGVSDGNFIPTTLTPSAVPYPVKYVYYEDNSFTTCVSEHVKGFTITANSTSFVSPKDTMCYNDDAMWITVDAVPEGAIPYTYYYSYGTYGYDYGFYMNTPYWSVTNNTNIGIVDEDLSNNPYSSSGAAWRVKIDPKILKPGYAGYRIYYLYLYYSLGGYYYQLRLPIITEQVSEVTSISNLKAEYCHADPPGSIQAYSLFPAGGSALWTGDILTNKTSLIAGINPGSGNPNGTVYPVTYQYTSKAGCKSNLFSTTVAVNPMPVASFGLDPLYNLDGDAEDLLPDIAPGAGYDASFVGPGVIKVEESPGVFAFNFLPGIADEGTKTLAYKVTTDRGCYAESTESTYVEKATGTFNGISARECYSDETLIVSISDLPDDTYSCDPVNFWNKNNSMVWTAGSLSAEYNIAAAQAGYDTLYFTYKKRNVDFTIKKPVYIDSIGNITISGLKEEYCDYEGLATVRALVENSTGAGSFTFTGPATALTNYLGYAVFDPTKVTTGTQYYVNYTHVSAVNNSGCTKTESVPVTVNLSPSVSISNDRVTVNIKEAPVILSGSPSDGIFSGKGVYKSGSDYVFDPDVAGLGEAEFALSYTDIKGCSTTKKDTLNVAAASGSILGLNANNQYCYDGLKDTITYTSSKPWFNGSFSGAGITNIASAKAVFDPAAAGKGDHDLVFTYYDQYDTEFEISATVNVDSLGVVEIKPVAAGDEYCNNDAPFELITTPRGGVFTGPVTTGYLNPSKALGDTAVTYTYLNVRTGCSITGRVPFTIHPAPVVSFTTSDICIENETDSIRFINNTTSADAVSSWLWSFSDIGGTDLSSKQAPAYIFKSGGQHLITLTATTINNCIVKKDVTVDLGVKPKGDFYWTNECYVPGDSIMLFDTTFSTSAIVSRSWNFFDGSPLKTGTKLKYPKNAVGVIPVQYIVNTAYANCSDTVTKNVYVRPNIVLTADGYFEDFESGDGGWSRGDDSPNSWSFGTPDRNTIKSAASGITAWFTRFDSTMIESSSVISPCYDFTNIERPMIGLGIRRNFDEKRDGAALQYRIGDAGKWTHVGTSEDGINWYGRDPIEGNPGGSPIGWTTKVADPTWTEARHTLDELKGKKDVKLRIAYGSDGTANSSEGMAFDDIFIGERKRNVLIEHFANTSSSRSSEATGMINAIDLLMDKDVVNIQYHTNFPGVDSFYVSNPADASARILYYGLTKAPYSFVDGGTNVGNSEIFNYSSIEFDNSLTPIDVNKIIRRSLISPVFDIRLDSLNVSGGVLTISGNIVALDDITLSNLTLYLAVIEKTNSKYTGALGETLFRNVFRKFVPDAAGINLGKTWTKGTPVPIQDQTWIISKTLNSSDIEVVAFIQNSVTKEVYQAASMLKPKIIVGIEKTGILDNIDYMLYPNPAKHQLTIRFGEVLEDDTDIFIYDFGGTIVRAYKTGSGETEYVIDDLSLKDGIYLIRVSSGGVNYGFRKLIISGS